MHYRTGGFDSGAPPDRLRAHCFNASKSATDNLASRWIHRYLGGGMIRALVAYAICEMKSCCSSAVYSLQCEKFMNWRALLTSL